MKKISLSFGDFTAVFLPEYGMNTVSLRYKGIPILREAADDAAFSAEPLLYGIPVLLPANRTKGGRFSFGDKEYTLPLNEPTLGNNLHGSLYNATFEVLSVTESAVTSRIVNSGEHYPFPFELTFEDRLSEKGFTRTATLKNTSGVPMPYTFAFHNTFAEPESFSVPVGERLVWDSCYIPTGERVPLDGFEATMLTSCVPDGREISAPYTSVGGNARVGGFHFEVSGNFDRWVFYNGNGREGYLCVEPQCGDVNGLNSGSVRVLPSGENHVFTVFLGI